MYLSSIQQGIQAAHVIGNMSAKYRNADSDYTKWANDHKTIILLNGGMSCNLHSIVEHFMEDDNPYDWSCFTESQEALDGTITSVGIILPDDAYLTATKMRTLNSKMNLFGIPSWEIELYEIMNSCRLAI